MTRVTPLPRELTKLTRCLGSTIAAPSHNTQLLIKSSRAVAAKLNVRKELENAPPTASLDRAMTTSHRPSTAPVPNPHRTIPLMQAFHTTGRAPAAAAAAAAASPATIDCAFLPTSLLAWHSVGAAAAAAPPLRYPLLPDHFAPGAALAPALFAPEERGTAPLRAPEIAVLGAGGPAGEAVVSALSEVEGMGPDGVELRFIAPRGAGEPEGEQYAGGMLMGVWKGLVEDLGGAGRARPAL